MHTRVANLVKSSSVLRRQIWASLPWRVRVADFFTRLAVSMTDAFGEAVYGEFLKKQVEKMPAHKGTSAESLNPRRPPRGYGKDFGKKAYRVLMRKYHNPELVEDIMSEFLVRFLSGSYQIKPGATLAEAENYVILGLRSQAQRILKKKKEISDVYFTDGEENKHELSVVDEDSVESQVKKQLPKMKSKLKAIHPDAEKYIILSLIEGRTDREIIGDVENGIPSMLDHPYSKHDKPLNERLWGSYKTKIYDVLKSNFDYLQVSV